MNVRLFAEPCVQKVEVVRLDDSYPFLAAVSIINRKEKCHRIEKNSIEVKYAFMFSCSSEYRERSYHYPASA